MLTGCRYGLLQHCCWSSAKTYISILSFHNLLRLCTSNVDRSNERKLLYTDKKARRRYPAETITGSDYADDIAIFANTPTQAESLLHSREQTTGGNGLYGKYGRNVSSTESDVNIRLAKPWIVIDRLCLVGLLGFMAYQPLKVI